MNVIHSHDSLVSTRALAVHVMVEKSFLTGRQVRSVGGMEGEGGWVLPYHMFDMYPAASAAGGE